VTQIINRIGQIFTEIERHQLQVTNG